MLKITGEGRKAALDLRLVGLGRDHPNNKLSLAAGEIFKIWAETQNQKSAQLVFCDLSTPQQGTTKEFSAYDDLKAKLMKLGVPEPEIAFIQDYDSDTAKSSLFKKVRAGQVRVLMGSTQKMGNRHQCAGSSDCPAPSGRTVASRRHRTTRRTHLAPGQQEPRGENFPLRLGRFIRRLYVGRPRNQGQIHRPNHEPTEPCPKN